MSAKTEKVFVLGIDGMDPVQTKKYLDAGLMPNLKKFLEKGACREDLHMIGGQPTVTPPMWTTLGTGAWPSTHGLTAFTRRGENLSTNMYCCDSRYVKAEFLWNTALEAGKKVLAWHWIAGWPPTSDSPDFHVVDGTAPTAVNTGVAEVDGERIVIASEETQEVLYKNKMGTDSNIPCFIPGMEFEEQNLVNTRAAIKAKKYTHVAISHDEARHHQMGKTPLDYVFSPIKPAVGWANAPENAKEFTILLSDGLVRRPCLILKNADGIYDHVAIYKNKKAIDPIAVLENDVFTKDIVDEAIKNDKKILTVNRSMRILELAEDGHELRLWISPGMDYSENSLFKPQSLLNEIIEAVGYPQPNCMACGFDEKLMDKVLFKSWDIHAEWASASLKYLINKYQYDLVMSHFHNVDHLAHMLVGELKGTENISTELCQKYYQRIYMQADWYIGQFLELLNDGWTIFIVSDHGLTCPRFEQTSLYFSGNFGASALFFEEMGYTVLKRDENGNRLPEINWERTVAVRNRNNHIFINLKGRDPHGIVDPKDKYELEERIMADLCALRDPVTGHRLVALALRNRDAMLLGHGGPDSGDIVFYINEEFCGDHEDTLSTARGACDTSMSSVFMAAGPGIKPGYTERVIRHADLTPTIATMMDIRMPKHCEGAPIYQIIND